MTICNLASGSHGNATFVEAGDTSVLIDCGLPIKEIESRLARINKKPEQIEAILVTHEHNDHILGVVAFCLKYNVKVFVHAKTIVKFGFLFEKIRNNICLFQTQDFYFKSLTISPFELSHDASFCVGFALYAAGKKMSIATDTGFLSQSAIEAMKNSNVVLIESNHDEKMLMFGPYPARLKRRIASEIGHLSNKQCADAVKELAACGTRHFVLCHLSEKNNLQSIAFKTTFDALVACGLSATIDVASQSAPSKLILV